MRMSEIANTPGERRQYCRRQIYGKSGLKKVSNFAEYFVISQVIRPPLLFAIVATAQIFHADAILSAGEGCKCKEINFGVILASCGECLAIFLIFVIA